MAGDGPPRSVVDRDRWMVKETRWTGVGVSFRWESR